MGIMRTTQATPLLGLLSTLCLFLFVMVLQFINRLPSVLGQFNTQEPFSYQLIRLLGPVSLGLLIKAAMLSSAAVFIATWRPAYRMRKNGFLFAAGLSVGALWAGSQSLLKVIIPRSRSFWADYSALGTYVPLFSNVVSSVMHHIEGSIVLALLFILLSHCTSRLSQPHYKRLLALAFSLFFGFVLVGGPQPIDSIAYFVASGIVIGLMTTGAYIALMQYDYALILAVTAGYRVLRLIQQAALGAYPFASAGALISTAIIITITWGWYVRVNTVRE